MPSDRRVHRIAVVSIIIGVGVAWMALGAAFGDDDDALPSPAPHSYVVAPTDMGAPTGTSS